MNTVIKDQCQHPQSPKPRYVYGRHAYRLHCNSGIPGCGMYLSPTLTSMLHAAGPCKPFIFNARSTQNCLLLFLHWILYNEFWGFGVRSDGNKPSLKRKLRERKVDGTGPGPGHVLVGPANYRRLVTWMFLSLKSFES